MENCKVYPISELPFYLVETSTALQFLVTDSPEFVNQPEFQNNGDDSIDENIAPGFEPESITKNNHRNILVGNLGEEIAQAYLGDKYPSTKYPKAKRIALEKSNEGYDIVAKGFLCFEVKTSTAKNLEFEITVNELRTANEKKQDYHLFYIAVDTSNKTALGFIFDNPIWLTDKSNERLSEFQKLWQSNVCRHTNHRKPKCQKAFKSIVPYLHCS